MLTKSDIENYFNAEKTLALWFILLGIAAIVVALVFYFYCKTNWYKGAAIPLLLVGLLQFGASFSIYKKTDVDRMRNVYAFDMNPPELKLTELPRMEKISKTFLTLITAEIVLLIIGIGLFFYFRNNVDKHFWAGFGIALFIEASICLSADTIASKRAAVYNNALQEFAGKR